MRTGISIEVMAADRARLDAIVANRNSPQKHVWRARIVLLTADGLGTNEIMRQTARARPSCGAGRSGSCRKASPASCATRRGRRATRPGKNGDRAGRRADGRRPAWRSDALDGAGDGQGDRDQRLLGAAHLARAWSPAAPGPSVQAVARSEVCRQVPGHRRRSTSTRRPMRSCCRSTKRAKSRRSTAPSPACQ